MPPTHLLSLPPRRSPRRLLLSISLPTLFATATMSTTSPNSSTPNYGSPPTYPTGSIPPPPSSLQPPKQPLSRMDETDDSAFYSQPRFVTHIDGGAISRLREYYRWTFWEGSQDHEGIDEKGESGGVQQGHESTGSGKKRGKIRILDLCASWVSHFPACMEKAAIATARRIQDKTGSEEEVKAVEDGEGKELEIWGLGMNKAELNANPILTHRIIQDLNTHPHITLPSSLSTSTSPTTPLNATTCVVSIDYLTSPLSILSSLLSLTALGGSIHLVLSNRCFPTKVAGEWLRLSEMERVELVGRYLWWSGWVGVEVVDLCEKNEGGEEKGWIGRMLGGGGGGDPLWVVRGVKGDGRAMGEEERVGKTEL
ncbi:MAG: hypothetical protein Q9176_004745 [Flavoplaca citrina]